MELRTILFGYKKEQFAYFIEETEAQLVREIFTRYISGETLLQIANDFTVRQVTYYKGKNTWNKNAIRRIIENEHYCGDMFSKGTTELVLKAPKTKTSVRKVFLPKTVALMLAERKKQIDELKELFGEEYSDYTRR